jgi:hypothetical protein
MDLARVERSGRSRALGYGITCRRPSADRCITLIEPDEGDAPVCECEPLGAGDELSKLSSGTSVARLGLSALVDRVWLFLGK